MAIASYIISLIFVFFSANHVPLFGQHKELGLCLCRDSSQICQTLTFPLPNPSDSDFISPLSKSTNSQQTVPPPILALCLVLTAMLGI